MSKYKETNGLCFPFIGKEVGETVMYFGCRHKNEDYIYQEELEDAEKKGVLTQLNVAFSRDQDQKVQMDADCGFKIMLVNVFFVYKMYQSFM